jgi:hypothetical protein
LHEERERRGDRVFRDDCTHSDFSGLPGPLGRHSGGAADTGGCARRKLSSGNRGRSAGGADKHRVELAIIEKP